MRGLVAAQMAAQPTQGQGAALASCHDAISETGAALLARAQRDGTAPDRADIGDLLKLVNAIAWASEQAQGDEELMDRLLAYVTGSLEAAASAGHN
jgi:cytochrome P450